MLSLIHDVWFSSAATFRFRHYLLYADAIFSHAMMLMLAMPIDAWEIDYRYWLAPPSSHFQRWLRLRHRHGFRRRHLWWITLTGCFAITPLARCWCHYVADDYFMLPLFRYRSMLRLIWCWTLFSCWCRRVSRYAMLYASAKAMTRCWYARADMPLCASGDYFMPCAFSASYTMLYAFFPLKISSHAAAIAD